MARGVNRVTLVGYVGAEPEMMHSEQGTPICNISLATTEGWRDMNGQVQTRTEWHRVVFFRRIAEIAVEFLHKGSLVYVEGKLSTSRWTDQEGIVRYTTQIICTELQILSTRRQDQVQGGSAGYGAYGNNEDGDAYVPRNPDGSYTYTPSTNANAGKGGWNLNLKKKQFNQKGKHGPSDYAAGFRSGQYGGKAASYRTQAWAKGEKSAKDSKGPVVNEPQLNDDGIDVNAPL